MVLFCKYKYNFVKYVVFTKNVKNVKKYKFKTVITNVIL